MPKGDWIWPAIWLLPKHNYYGNWPASGEIDLIESRGNGPECDAGGVDTFGSTLHYGPNYMYDAWDTAHAEHKHTANLNEDFHTYELEWTEEHIITRFDGTEVLNFPFDEDLWTKGKFPAGMTSPWAHESDKTAPFN